MQERSSRRAGSLEMPSAIARNGRILRCATWDLSVSGGLVFLPLWAQRADEKSKPAFSSSVDGSALHRREKVGEIFQCRRLSMTMDLWVVGWGPICEHCLLRDFVFAHPPLP